jgi:MFS family permease
VLLIAFLLFAVALVPLGRGDLRELGRLRFRGSWLLGVALAMQLALYAFPGQESWLRQVVYVGSYPLALGFVVANRKIPGVWLIGLGAALNILVISANAGTMPAAPHALAAAGLPLDPGQFTNSLALASPRLLFLGDVFAVPKGVPFANVFSIGDIAIALGAALVVHRVCRSRLVPGGDGQFSILLKDRNFMRVWAAQGVSNLGDWVYALAVAATLASRGGTRAQLAQTLALLLVAQVGPAALCGFLFAGPLVDRFPRRTLMVVADVLRALAVATLLFDPHPAPAHFYAVAVCLGVFGAVFQPALQSSIPNLVDEDRLVAANALVATTYQIAVMAGPALGGVLIASFAPRAVFSLNALSFGTSAMFLAFTRIPQATREHAWTGLRAARAELTEGFRYAMSSRLIRGIFIATSVVMLGAASKTPVEPLFVRQVLSPGTDLGRTAQVLGLISGAWGMGMLLGSFAAPALARRWPRERLLPIAITVVGALVVVVSHTTDFSTVLLAWLAAGSANAVGNVSYDSLLQERTPDALRGRVFAASEAVLDTAYLGGAVLAGWLAGAYRASTALSVSGGILIVAAALGAILIPVGPGGAVEGALPVARSAPAPSTAADLEPTG